MSLEFLLNNLCDVAIRYNLINYAAAGGSIYELNAETINGYPALFLSPTDDIYVDKSTTTYGLTVFYIDRLLGDSSNATQIYSNAILTITNFLRQVKSLDGILDVEDYNIRVFSETEKMNDRLNGAYARVRIRVLNTLNCSLWFDETGEPIGTYVPEVIQDVNVLDNLASKAWVRNYVAEHSGGSSGGTDEQEVKRLIRQALRDYTKTKDFATINGSGITSGQTFSLIETDTFNTAVENIYAAISASTPADYAENVAKIAKNTDDIAALSGTTSGLSSDIQSLSAYTATLTATTADLAALSAATSAVSVQVETLSGDTSDLRAFLGDLSASTTSAVSSITSDILALSGATVALSGATTGIVSDLSDLSAVTSGFSALIAAKQDALTAGDNITIDNNVISAAGNVSSTSLTTIWSGTQQQYNNLGTYDNSTLYVITDANT